MFDKGMVVVIGDAMLDRHIHGSTERISPEAPVPVVLKHKEEWAIGAAANTAAHVIATGTPCTLFYRGGLFDGDENASKLRQMCLAKGVVPRTLEPDRKMPVTVKTRIWSGSQQVCRIDEEDVAKPVGATEAAWIKQVKDFIDTHQVSVVIFSDYDKGTLTDGMIFNIASMCSQRGIPTILDPKRGSFSNISGITIAKPNARELKATGLTAVECSARMSGTWLVNTLGKHGMVVYRDGEQMFSCPTVAEEVVDVCGCGDTVTALLALSMLCRANRQSPIALEDIKWAVTAANKGASYTIRHKGCYVPTAVEIMKCLERNQ